MLSSNTWERSGGKGGRRAKTKKEVLEDVCCCSFLFILVYQYQDIICVKCTQDDKYPVLWHCSSHTCPTKKKKGSERINATSKRGASVEGQVPLALEGDEGEERITGFFRLLLGL